MRIKFLWLRLPLIIFVILVLSLLSSGLTIINSVLTSNLTEDGCIYFKTDLIEFKFPRNWSAGKWKYENGSKSLFGVSMTNIDSSAYICLAFHNKESTREIMERYNLTNEMEITLFEVKLIYEGLSKSSEQAVLHFIENGTMPLSCGKAYYRLIFIENALKRGGVLYNFTGIFASILIKDRLLEIFSYDLKNTWNETRRALQIILDSLVVKEE